VIETNLERNEGKSPKWESKECAFIYSLRNEKTFESYLRWYDLAIGTDYQKPNGYSFRTIAFLNYIWLKYPKLYERTKEAIASRTKIIQSTKGERVEKAVKLIYNAIHRKQYPSKKTHQRQYNCPTHGGSCPKDCSYLKTFMKDFNRRNMLFLPLKTTDPTALPQVAGEARLYSKRKPTADQQFNTK
jgi:hypothetical protein